MIYRIILDLFFKQDIIQQSNLIADEDMREQILSWGRKHLNDFLRFLIIFL